MNTFFAIVLLAILLWMCWKMFRACAVLLYNLRVPRCECGGKWITKTFIYPRNGLPGYRETYCQNCGELKASSEFFEEV